MDHDYKSDDKNKSHRQHPESKDSDKQEVTEKSGESETSNEDFEEHIESLAVRGVIVF
ncbi:MAG: hypothetical protein ACXADL_05765 [Candidatus Thorarchaeota archaeon]|jgi:hypothetical protein